MEWFDEQNKVTIALTPEILLKLFKRISDEDVKYMGFSPTFSRPEWMIWCFCCSSSSGSSFSKT